MDEDHMLIICRSCGRKTLMENMRADGDNMICMDCYKKSAGAKSVTSVFGKKPVENEPFKPAKSKGKVEKSEKMIRYICTNCKYKFSRKESQSVEKCPYCSKNTIVHDDQLGAENLIKDSTDKRFDW